MFKCPVCEQNGTGLLCSSCGFDGSRNLETYPTLGKQITGAKAVSAMRIAWNKNHLEDIFCRVCGDRRFTINRNTGIITCFSCHTPLSEKLEKQAPPTPKMPEIIRHRSSSSGLYVPPEGCRVVSVGCTEKETRQLHRLQGVVDLSVSNRHTLALKHDGSVEAISESPQPECQVDHWKEIIDITAAFLCSYGLRRNGTVACAGSQIPGLDTIQNWNNIRFLRAGGYELFGLTADGHVVTTDPSCKFAEFWDGIKDIAAGQKHCIGLRNDGTVVTTGQTLPDGHRWRQWQDIISVAAGDRHVVGLRSDGTVAAFGDSSRGQCSVQSWRNIVEIAAGRNITAGLRADGTVVCTSSWLDTSHWQRIAAIAVSDVHIVGLQLSEEQYRAQQVK